MDLPTPSFFFLLSLKRFAFELLKVREKHGMARMMRMALLAVAVL